MLCIDNGRSVRYEQWPRGETAKYLPGPGPQRKEATVDNRDSSATPAHSPPEGQRDARERGSCYGTGYALEDVAYCPASGEPTGEIAPYGSCKGAVEASHFVYGV